MNNLARKIEIFVIVVVIALVGIIYAFKKPAIAPTASQNTQQQVPSNVIQYQGQDSQTALVLLEANHRVDVKHYSFGDMVIGIDGIEPDSQHFWAMYVNNQFSQVGASVYVTKSSDTIKWEIDTVNSN